jgi:hypothetical protein
MMRGSLNWLTGNDTRSAQASARAVAGCGGQVRRCWGLKACRYRAVHSVWAGGRWLVGVVSRGVMVARASARLARECGARCGHFISMYITACWYQVVVSGCGVGHEVGCPVAGSKAWPRRAARTNSAR